MPERRRKANSNRRRRRAAPLPKPPPPVPPPPPAPAARSPPRRPASPAALPPPSPSTPTPSPPPPSPPPREQSPRRTVCRPLRWCIDRPDSARPGQAEWTDLAHAAVPLACHLTRDREPAEPHLDPMSRLKHQDPMDGDDPYTWLSIGQGIPTTIGVMNLGEYGPVITGPVRTSPFPEQGLPDRPLPENVFDVNALSINLFQPFVKVASPMEIANVILFRRVFESIAVATNFFAHGRGRGDPMLAGWQDTHWVEMYRFFMANHLIMAIRIGTSTISEEQLFRNPLLARMFSPRRFHQLTLAWRLKTDNQTPDQFLEFAPRVLCSRFEKLLVRAAPVLILHTYQMPFWCGRHKEIMDAECRITVLKTGRYTLRMVFHLKAIDSQQSGNSASISVPLLEKLLRGIDLEGKYFTAIGGATVEMAKFFHLRKAYFVGSVGPQAYRLLNPQKADIPTPELPEAGLYLEPYPDIREVILLREVTRLSSRLTWIGFPVSDGPGLQYTHLVCNIGGGERRSIFVPGPKKTTLEVRIPDSLWSMRPMGDANSVGVHHLNFENVSGANRGCMLWHQRVTMHLLNMGFVNAWHAHSIATGRPLSSSDAFDDIYHHLFGFVYDWVIRTRNLRCEPPLGVDDEHIEEWDIPLSRGKLRFRIARRGPLQVGVERDPNAPPGENISIMAALSTVHGNGDTALDASRMPTHGGRSVVIDAEDSAANHANARGDHDDTPRTVAWTQLLWRSLSMLEGSEWRKPGEPYNEWHGVEVRNSPRKSADTVTIRQTMMNDLKTYPLLSPNARARGKRPARPTLGAVEVFYWGHLKMLPYTPSDGRPWRGARPRRTSV